MAANTNMTLTERLKMEMKKRKVSAADFEQQTGIPKDRVYKWIQRGADNIKQEDAAIVEGWLSGQLDTIPKSPSKLDDAIFNLSESARNHSEIDLINARNIERLINILEGRLLGGGLELPTPGTPGTRTLKNHEDKEK